MTEIAGVDAVSVSYTIAFVGLLAGIGIALALLNSEADSREGGFKWLLAIPTIAAVSYLLMVLDIGVVTVDGDEVYLFRYIDWLLTTPLLVGYVAYVAGAPRRWVLGVAGADAGMIAVGMVATLTTGIATWVGFGVSALFHLVLLGVLYLVLPRYVESHPRRRRLFKVLQNHVGLLWLAYPVIWLLSPAGVGAVSAVGTAMIIAYIDLVAKTPYVYFVWRDRMAFAEDEGEFGTVENISETTAASAD
jgi:sensory rhodopsin